MPIVSKFWYASHTYLVHQRNKIFCIVDESKLDVKASIDRHSLL